PGRSELLGRGSRDRLQRQLSARCAERDRRREGGDRTDGCEQQLPDPRAGCPAHTVRRHADAAVSAPTRKYPRSHWASRKASWGSARARLPGLATDREGVRAETTPGRSSGSPWARSQVIGRHLRLARLLGTIIRAVPYLVTIRPLHGAGASAPW